MSSVARAVDGRLALSQSHDESDESVVEKWTENPHWQYFCGEQLFQHELPCHPTSFVKWRKQFSAQGVEKLLKQVLKTVMGQQAFTTRELKAVSVDPTVQEKAITFPMDARLYDKARRALVRAAKRHRVKL